VNRQAYHCLRCDHRFWDRPRPRRLDTATGEAAGVEPAQGHRVRTRRRRRVRTVMRLGGPVDQTPYSRTQAYIAIALGWIVVLAIFFALRAVWPAAETVVRSID
jgi:hypothetical protein